MNLTDLKPRESKLKLKAFKNELVLHPITLADEAWLDEEYGSEKVMEIFENVNIKEISRIVYRLLTQESKKHFKKQKVEIIDEQGNSEEIELGGVDLLRASVTGWEEKIALFNCLLDNIGLSRPDSNVNAVKKNKIETETIEMSL